MCNDTFLNGHESDQHMEEVHKVMSDAKELNEFVLFGWN